MFVQYYGMVERPFSEVESDLLSIGDALAESADVAYRHGEGLLVRLRGGAVAKTVMLDLRTPVRGTSLTTLPLEWWATGTPALFPKMEAELTVADVGARSPRCSSRAPISRRSVPSVACSIVRCSIASLRFPSRISSTRSSGCCRRPRSSSPAPPVHGISRAE